MSDSIFLVGPDGALTEAASTAYDAEDDLQKLIADNIHLLPGAQINEESPRRWLLIKREAGIPNRDGGGAWWSIDHLAVDQDAVPTFVEVKRASDTRARREVVAQMLDYAANGSVFWAPEQLRAWFEAGDPAEATARLMSFLGAEEEDSEEVASNFWRLVGANLRDVRLRLVFVADEIPASLRRLVEFLNEQMPRIEVLAVEIRQYQTTAGGAGALVPRLIGQTARAQASKESALSAPRRSERWTAGDVIEVAALAGPAEADVARAVADWATAHPNIRVTGGTGAVDRSFAAAAETGSSATPLATLLQVYGSPKGGRPLLELRISQLREIPPFDQQENLSRLVRDLRALGIPRINNADRLRDIRPNIALTELTDGRITSLLAVVDRWITQVRAHHLQR